jgi:hypothetical protein
MGVFLLTTFVAYYLFGEGISAIDTNSDKSKNEISVISEYELTFIYIGCSTCPPSSASQLPGLIEDISHNLQKVATEKGFAYHTVGISNEVNIADGIQHLKNIYDFKEISLGSNMKNISVHRYV